MNKCSWSAQLTFSFAQKTTKRLTSMSQISLKNFRKYETLEPLFLNGLNIFVGKNNAGKSTVVKAIMLALDNLRSLRWNNVPSGDTCKLPWHNVT